MFFKEGMFDTYIFDLDGTLIDTLDDLTVSVNYALHKLNMKTHSKDAIRQFLGNGARALIERAVEGGAQNPMTKWRSFSVHTIWNMSLTRRDPILVL